MSRSVYFGKENEMVPDVAHAIVLVRFATEAFE